MVEASTHIEGMDFTGRSIAVGSPKRCKTRTVNTGSDNKVVEH